MKRPKRSPVDTPKPYKVYWLRYSTESGALDYAQRLANYKQRPIKAYMIAPFSGKWVCFFVALPDLEKAPDTNQTVIKKTTIEQIEMFNEYLGAA